MGVRIRRGMSTNHNHHDHAHTHDEHGHHHHSHAPHFDDVKMKNFGFAFVLGAALNIIFVIVELVVGFSINSLALIADAGHNAGDVLGLLMSLGAYWVSKKHPIGKYSYGFGQATIMASLANSALLVFASGAIAIEAIHRLFDPQMTGGKEIMIVAAIGVFINFATAMLFMKGQKGDLNVRSAFLHMMFDGLVSVGVILAGGIIMLTGWSWVDPLIGIVIAIVILWGGWGLMRESVNLSLAATPAKIDPKEVHDWLLSIEGVIDIHDLHIWPLSTTETAMTVHVVMPKAKSTDEFLELASETAEHRFGINHATFQIENEFDCELHSHAPRH